MFYGSYRFKPGAVSTLTTLLLLPALMALGFWQLDRAGEKRTLQAFYDSRKNLPAIRLEAGLSEGIALRYRNIRATGHYLSEPQILLNNQIHKNAVGYYLFTIFILQDSDVAVLVNRGWMPKVLQVPPGNAELSVSNLKREISGMISPPPATGMRLGSLEPAHNDDDRLVLPYLDLQWLGDTLNCPLLPYVILLDPDLENGLIRDWQRPRLNPQRHLAYAFQWFALSLTLGLYYVFASLKRVDEVDPSQSNS